MTTTDKKILRFALAFALLVFAAVGFIICRYYPTGITVDDEGNVVLNTFIGSAERIPQDCIRISDVPEDWGENLIRTNGAAFGHIRYGHFKNTQTKQRYFLYMTGKDATVSFTYNDQIYITDDWRKQ